MAKECDNTSVGVIVRDPESRFALLERKKFPIGFAPPAGHIDEHGSPEQAAVDEVGEEVGITLSLDGLRKVIDSRRVNNRCRREGGDHHVWTVYEASVDAQDMQPSEDETKGAKWYTQDEVQSLADRTRSYQAGQIPEEEWAAHPGLEEIWVDFLSELGHIR